MREVLPNVTSSLRYASGRLQLEKVGHHYAGRVRIDNSEAVDQPDAQSERGQEPHLLDS